MMQIVRLSGDAGREGQQRQGLCPGHGEPAQVPGVRRGEREATPPEIEMIDFDHPERDIHDVIMKRVTLF